MRAGKGADRPSVLAVNPRNQEASAARRIKLLEAFLRLSEDDAADLLEAAETLASRQGGVDSERDEARRVIHLMYTVAGWDDGRARV